MNFAGGEPLRGAGFLFGEEAPCPCAPRSRHFTTHGGTSPTRMPNPFEPDDKMAEMFGSVSGSSRQTQYGQLKRKTAQPAQAQNPWSTDPLLTAFLVALLFARPHHGRHPPFGIAAYEGSIYEQNRKGTQVAPTVRSARSVTRPRCPENAAGSAARDLLVLLAHPARWCGYDHAATIALADAAAGAATAAQHKTSGTKPTDPGSLPML